MIDHVVIVVPAHNESALLLRCLDALSEARSLVRRNVSSSVVVVADACTDATAAVANLRLRQPPDLVMATSHRCVGAARRDGVTAGLSQVNGDWRRKWIASTDADTVVPPTWLADQLRIANHGVAAVAGIVELLDDTDVDPALEERFRDYYRVGADGGHHHVHGANLGIRATAYRNAGGWRAIPTGEEHDLWNRLRRLGLRTVSTSGLVVATSARRTGRAPAGFAADLAALQRPVARAS